MTRLSPRETPQLRRRPGVARRRSSWARRAAQKPLFRLTLSSLVLAGLALWLFEPSSFGLRKVVVSGAERIPEARVQEILEPHLGSNLLTLPFHAVHGPVIEIPWVRAVEIRKQLPDRLEIRLVEHQPVALLKRDDGLYYLNESGEVITQAGAGDETEPMAKRLVTLSYGQGAAEDGEEPLDLGSQAAIRQALSAVDDLKRGHGPWAEALAEMEILGDGDYRLRIRALPFPLLVSAETLEAKVRLLARLLPVIHHRYATVEGVDLRFRRRIVLDTGTRSRPAAGAAG